MAKYNCEIFIGGPADGQMHNRNHFSDERIPATPPYDVFSFEVETIKLEYIRREVQPAGTGNVVMCYAHDSLTEQQVVALIFDWLLEEAELPEIEEPLFTFTDEFVRWSPQFSSMWKKWSEDSLSQQIDRVLGLKEEPKPKREDHALDSIDFTFNFDGEKFEFEWKQTPQGVQDLADRLGEGAAAKIKDINDNLAEHDRRRRTGERARRSR